MELKVFNETTFPVASRISSLLPKISFTSCGIIQFNAAAANLLQLDQNQKIAIAADKENPQDWYVFKSEKDGYPLKPTSKNKALRFNHKSLIEELFESIGLPTNKSRTFLIGGKPTIENDTTYWGILVKK